VIGQKKLIEQQNTQQISAETARIPTQSKQMQTRCKNITKRVQTKKTIPIIFAKKTYAKNY